MTLEMINTVVQMIANIAVIASLIFVVLQVGMGIKMLRDAAMRNHNEKHQSISRAVFENPQLAELWTRGSKSGLANSLGRSLRANSRRSAAVSANDRLQPSRRPSEIAWPARSGPRSRPVTVSLGELFAGLLVDPWK